MSDKLRVLVVDDSKVVRKAFSRILGETYDLLEAEDGEGAWELLNQHADICAVFTDLNMPHLDGRGLVQRIRASEDQDIASLPIILVTAADESTDTTKDALTAGATDYVIKPFDSVFLQSKARAYVVPRDKSAADGKLATLDPVTRLANRTFFIERGEQEVSAANRHKAPLALLLTTIDNFEELKRQTNERLLNGIIRKLGTYMSSEVRLEDTVARIEKNRFAMLLSEAGLAQATEMVERLRLKVQQKVIRHKDKIFKVTISTGISSLPPDVSRTFDMLMLEADRHLKQAIEKGGDCTVPAPNREGKSDKALLTTSLDEADAMLSRRDEKMSPEQAAVTVRHMLPLLEHCDKLLNLNLTEQIKALRSRFGRAN
ncbi:MAG: diguanylate cyclase [Gammaproteobacteria bacterium]|nr:diguanylate cyclase [Gammaproteobacteria bacterium]